MRIGWTKVRARVKGQPWEVIGDLVLESRRGVDLPFHQLLLEPVARDLTQRLRRIRPNSLRLEGGFFKEWRKKGDWSRLEKESVKRRRRRIGLTLREGAEELVMLRRRRWEGGGGGAGCDPERERERRKMASFFLFHGSFYFMDFINYFSLLKILILKINCQEF